MKNKLENNYLLLGFVTLSLGFSQAQEDLSPIRALLQVNPEVKAARLRVKAQEEAVKTAGVLPDPKFEFTTAFAPVETRNGPIEDQLMLGQKFPLWGKLSRQEKIAIKKQQLAELNLLKTELKVVNEFETDLAKWHRIRNSLTILDKYLNELNSFRKIALSQYSTGKGLTQHPILKLQIEQTLIQTKTNNLQGDWETVNQSLNRLFDGQMDSIFIKNSRIRNLPEEPPDGWMLVAVKTNPGLLVSIVSEDIATLKRELNEKMNYPDLTTGVTYTVVGPTELNGAVSSGKDALGVKLGINIPLWFKRNRARVESARQMESSTKEKTQDIKNRLDARIESISKDLDEINETITLYEDRLIPEVEQMLSSAYAAYETGRISFLDLLDSERMSVNLQLEYERVKSKQLIVEANLNQTIGILESQEL